MPIKRPLLESQPRPSAVPVLRARPHKAVDVLRATDSETESEFFFDPKVDISKDEAREMFGLLDFERTICSSWKRWGSFGKIARELALIFPDRRSDLKLGEEEYRGLMSDYEKDLEKSDLFDLLVVGTDLAILFPERRAELKLGNKEFKKTKALLDEFREGSMNWFCVFAVRAVVLFPDRRSELGIGQDEFIEMKKELDKERSRGEWRNFGLTAMNTVLLYPDRKSELGLGEDEFNGMKSALSAIRKESDKKDLILLMNLELTVLAADRAEIASDGQIKIIYKPKPLVKSRKPLPERSRV